MGTVGLITFSDGRDFAFAETKDFCAGVERQIACALERAGHRVVCAQATVGSNEDAVRESRAVAAQRPDLTIFNYPVWAFPHFTMLAAEATTSPLLLFSNVDPKYPGMVGMLAAGGGLDQVDRVHGRAWGDIADAAVDRKSVV